MSEVGYSAARLVMPAHGTTGASITSRSADSASRADASRRTRATVMRFGFSLLAMLADFVPVIGAVIFADFSYNLVVHDAIGLCAANIQLGLIAATLFVISNLARHSYTVSDYLDLSGHAQRTFSLWNVAFLATSTFGFLGKIIEDSSRGTFIVFYFAGLCALFVGRAAMVLVMKRNLTASSALAARVLLVGFERDIEGFARLHPLSQQGMTVVAKACLPDTRELTDADLSEATALARRLMPDDIVIVVPWGSSNAIDKCVTAFMRVPASIHLHLDQNCPLTRFGGGSNVGTNGTISSFRLHGFAMNTAGMILKRLSDIVLASIGLILLAPLFLLVAAAIKLDSKGPVLFFQMRHGFNKVPFRILKFRSMSVEEDGHSVRQATTNDPRVTRVGRILRKYNIDELPQLVNVLLGQMSLVGPRPHALIHDYAFEQDITLYARRHNVKPGITGWAQVNGYRGETNTPDKIAQRVLFDLYYVDHWSFVFDLWIIVLTLFSRKAYMNAA
jgi:Undecaprenyl-phosphate glucose phosphotransferase